jgi:transcriptional regulator with XRE-family HTH domain
MITAEQIRAARGLLNWSQSDLAERSNLTLRQIGDIERGTADPRASILAAIEEAFSRAGVVMMEPDDQRGRGRGVRFIERE